MTPYLQDAVLASCQILRARPDTFIDTQDEVIAIGDLHGDFNAMVSVLQAARLIDENNNWSGGTTTLVQVGDQLDRGDTEKEILDLFELLIDQAAAAGGQVIVLNGNHETMNVDLDFRYITKGGFEQFQHYYDSSITDTDVLAKRASEAGPWHLSPEANMPKYWPRTIQ